MKIRIFTLLTAIFLLSNVSWGQEVGEYRVRKPEIITKKIEKPKKHKVVREINPQREGFYAKASVNIGFTCSLVPLVTNLIDILQQVSAVELSTTSTIFTFY